MHRWAGLLVVVTFLTGCSANELEGMADAAGEMSATSTSAPASGASSSSEVGRPPTTGAVDYGQQYLDLVAPSNCEFDRVGEILNALVASGEPSWEVVTERILPAFESYARSLVSFYEGLVAASWPPELQPIVDELVNEIAVRAQWFARSSAASSPDDLTAMLEPPAAGTAASRLRAELGLPSNIFAEGDPCADAPA